MKRKFYIPLQWELKRNDLIIDRQLVEEYTFKLFLFGVPIFYLKGTRP